MPMMIGGGAALGGIASMFGGKKGADSATKSAMLQYDATLKSLAQQERMANRGFGVFQSEADKARGFLTQQTNQAIAQMQPFRELGLQNLQNLSAFASDPNSAFAQSERANFQKVLARNLAARGLTASGTEMAGLNDFETSLLRERNAVSQGLAGTGMNAAGNIAGLQSGLGQGLAGISQQLGGSAMSLFGGLGTNMGNTLMAGAQGMGQAAIAGGQFQAQGLAGLNNAIQTGLMGFGQLNQMNQQNAFQQGLLDLWRKQGVG